jgi:tetratricopeptide (TPR) repeat protein
MKKMNRRVGLDSRLVFVLGLALGPLAGLRADPIPIKLPTVDHKDMVQAVQLLGQGKFKEADALFQKITQVQPGEIDAALGRAQVALSQQQLDRADQMVTDVLNHHQDLPEAHNMKGVVLLLRKNPDGARVEFARAVALQPRFITPHVYLAVMARTSGDLRGAEAQYEAIITVAPHLPVGYLGASEAQMMMRREGDALKTLAAWKSADPKTLLPYQVLANVYIAEGKPQDAIREAKAALMKSPHDSTSLALLGSAYAAAGDNRAAVAQYQLALNADKKNTDAAIRLGTLEAGTGQPDRALAHFKAALAVDPSNPVANNDAAYLLAEQGKDLNEALRLAQTAVTAAPKYADARDTLGWVHYRRGEYPQAVASLKEAKALAPTNPDIAAHLGLAYAKTGQKQKAIDELNQALKAGNVVSNRAQLEQTVAQLSSGK